MDKPKIDAPAGGRGGGFSGREEVVACERATDKGQKNISD